MLLKVCMTDSFYLLERIYMVFRFKKVDIDTVFFFSVFSPSKNVKFNFRWGTIPRKKKNWGRVVGCDVNTGMPVSSVFWCVVLQP